MLLKVDYNEEDVIHKGNGRIILKCKYYSQFSTLLHLATVEGSTEEDFDKNDCLKSKQIFVGQRGGISF